MNRHRPWTALLVLLLPGFALGQAVLLPPITPSSLPATPAHPQPHPAIQEKEAPFPKEVPSANDFPALRALCPSPHPIDLPTALRLADVQNPEIALARERVQTALAAQQRAEVLWLPHLDLAPAWTRHDGQIQDTRGEVFPASRSALFAGGGTVLSFQTGEAIFGSLAARQITEARQAGAAAIANDRFLDVALVYTDLLQVYAELQIGLETLGNARLLLKHMVNLEKAGKIRAADTARVRTEANIRERELLETQGRARVVSARLAQLLKLPPDLCLAPVEPALVPVVLVPEQVPLGDLIAQALQGRPELAENRALGRAVRERWRQSQLAPLLPTLQVSYMAGGFGGGRNSFFGDFDGRGDAAALAVWRLENLGFGTRAEQRLRQSEYNQTTLRQAHLEAIVGEQIVAAATLAQIRRQELPVAQRAVEAARESLRHNFTGIVNAPDQYRPIEPLQAVQALSRARLDYLQAVAGFNVAQFRLYAALGNPPAAALPNAVPLPLAEPVVPRR